MSPAVANIILRSSFSPYRLLNNAAIYSLDGPENAETYLTNGSGRVTLVADRSGNSALNGLVLNGVNGNYASAPDSAAVSVAGDLEIRANVALVDWTPSAINVLVGKAGALTLSYRFGVNTDGTLLFSKSLLGVAWDSVSSSVAPTVSDLGRIWLRVDYRASDGRVQFFTAPEGATWTQLGTNATTTAATAIFDGSTALCIGQEDSSNTNKTTGIVYYADVRNTIANDGSGIVLRSDFTGAAKLAGTFTETSSNAATVTINTSGDTGARICGARDLYQGTTAKMPSLSVSASGYNNATFDGTNDFWQSAIYGLVQPTCGYIVGSQVTWSTNDHIFDGTSADAGALFQNTSSPIIALYAGSAANNNGTLAVATAGVIGVAFSNSASTSSVRVNKQAAVTGQAGGAGNMNGVTVAARGDGAANFGNITFSEGIFRAVLDPESVQLQIAGYLMRKWGVAG